ncbi:AAA family ATPase [Actinomadura sp. 9N407]|uniref:AAA family ATPase n=1 Tax=Actinomadura sp. 9N407 TaxID=3375154 RepID=UPI0037AD7094
MANAKLTHPDQWPRISGIVPVRQRRRLAVRRVWNLVGRRAELDELLGVLERLGTGSRLIEVTGDAGIGKTALLSEFSKAARARGALVLASWGTEGPRDARYGAFDDVSLFEGAPEIRGRLAEFFPEDASLRHPPDRVVRELLEEMAAPALVLVIDDLHAADPGSLALLAGLLRRPPRVPVLFVVAYRDQQAGTALRSALDGASPHVGAAHLPLDALSEEEIGEILAEQGIASWQRQLYEDSQGNPAYLKALISERLASPGSVEQGGSPGHYAVFLRELDGVSEEARAAADAAAVAGGQFDAELVARMLDRPDSVTLAAIGELIGRGVVRPEARGPYFAFRHPLVHRAVYFGAELSRRMHLHSRADAVLRERGAAAPERAVHVEQRARHGDLEAVDVLDEAARAITGTAPVTAGSWLATALRVLPRGPEHVQRRARLLVRLAKARGAAGDMRGCRDTMHEALRFMSREPASEHAKAVAFTAMIQRMLGNHAETDAMLRAEYEALGEADEVGRAALVFEIASRELNKGDWSSCSRWAAQALELARRNGHRSQELACLGLMAKANVSVGELEVASGHLAAATAILDGMLDGDFAYSLDAVVWVGWSDALLERWDEALWHFDKAIQFAGRTGRLLALPHLLVGQVFALYNRGRLDEARRAAEYAVYLAQRSGSPEQLVSAYSMLAWADTIMGRFDRAEESGAVATGQFRGTVSGFEALALRMLAEARLMTGDAEGCLALVGPVGGPNLGSADACSRVAWYELLTRAELELDRPEAATKWAESATAAAQILDQPGRGALASLAMAQALLATDPEAALCSAERAASGLAAAGMAVDALRAKAVLGAALWHHDRYDDAVRELKDAQLGLERLGAVTLSRLARKERRRLAARNSRARTAATAATSAALGIVAVLTERERQIADLVGEGLTNRLIARRLHISEKTVEMHLSKVFAKLGVSNRAAVASMVTRDRPAADLA